VLEDLHDHASMHLTYHDVTLAYHKYVQLQAFFSSLLDKPHPLRAAFTCGADTPENMAAAARSYAQIHAIKLKLTGEAVDADRVRAVRHVRPEVSLTVDANQGFSRPSLERQRWLR
jgi:L-alanine-DL-glutamate epimerase-like enolase superfamily enzyme